MKKLILIDPPSKTKYKEEIKEGAFSTPLWISSLVAYIKKKIKINIKIYNGQNTNLKDFYKYLDFNADMVGISPKINNYFECIKIAREYKKHGALVIFGGHHATALYKNILLNRGTTSKDYCVDAIVLGDGEKALLSLLKNTRFEKIKNLAYIKNKKICKNKVEVLDLNELPIPERNFMNKDHSFYLDESIKKQGYKRPATLYSRKGCKWREKSGGCIFCSRTDKKHRTKTPKKVVEEIKTLVNKYGVDFIWDVSDDFLSDMEWFNAFYKEYKKFEDKPTMRIFARVNNITKDVTKKLSKMNISQVYIGAESGDICSLKKMHKGSTPKLNLNAVKALSKEGIMVHACHVLGAPGEDIKSLKNTIKQIKKFRKMKNVEVCSHILGPLPGSYAFKKLNRKLNYFYSNKDMIDSNKLIKKWVKNYCKVPCNKLIETTEIIEDGT